MENLTVRVLHDSMPRAGFVRFTVTMTPTNTRRASTSDAVATLSESTYAEPYLSRSAVPGLFLTKDKMPTLWRNVDATTTR